MIIEYGFADNDGDIKLLRVAETGGSGSAGVVTYFGSGHPSQRLSISCNPRIAFSIGKLYSVPIDRIKEDNRLTSDIIYPGAELIVRR